MSCFKLSTEEERTVSTSPTKTGFIGVVQFYNGPRGGKVRGIRTSVRSHIDMADRDLAKLANRNWSHQVRETELIEVNFSGEAI